MYTPVVICIDQLPCAGEFDLHHGMTSTIRVHIPILLLHVTRRLYIIIELVDII